MAVGQWGRAWEPFEESIQVRVGKNARLRSLRHALTTQFRFESQDLLKYVKYNPFFSLDSVAS